MYLMKELNFHTSYNFAHNYHETKNDKTWYINKVQ